MIIQVGNQLLSTETRQLLINRNQKVWDIARERMTHVCSHHAKGVHGFVWCRAYSLFASCGMERDVMVWQVGGFGLLAWVRLYA
jgi:hypothetical protein